jgi:transposase
MARRTREIWRNLIGQFERSGKKLEEFAREREIPVGTLKNWVYRIRREKEEEGTAVLPVRMISSRSPTASQRDNGAVEVMLLRFRQRDQRMSIDGLGALASARGHDVFSGHLFAFTSRRGDRVKILVWDRGGPEIAPGAEEVQLDATEPGRAREALALVGELFRIERQIAEAPRKDREAVRRRDSRLFVERFFAWCESNLAEALDETPLAKRMRYAFNQRRALVDTSTLSLR